MVRDLFAQLEHIRSVLHSVPRGLVTDVDGTISEIAPSPGAALVSAPFKQHLRTLMKRFDLVAAISGRSVDSLRSMVGVDGLVCFGNHGLEWWEDGRSHFSTGVEPYVHIVRSALEDISKRLSVDGATIENKGATVAIHYRQAADIELARQAILSAIHTSPAAQALRVCEGKMVVELRPPMQLHKGQALASLVLRHGLHSVIYIGDDTTDVDAFNQLRKMRAEGSVCGLAIAVLGPETPAQVIERADATLQGVAEVETFFKWLIRELGGENLAEQGDLGFVLT